jgi:folate-binding protein YgfZ
MTAVASPTDQLAALRTGCGVLAPARAFVAVAGPDAEAFLQNLLTQDLAGIADGESRRALLLTPKAKVLADVRVTRLGPDSLVLDVEPTAVDGLVKQLTRYRLGSKATIEATNHWSLLSLIGPGALAIDLPGTRIESALGDLPRIDLIVPTSDLAASLDAAVHAGAVSVDAAAVEALRVEAGEVRLGHDIDERWMPAEVGLVEATVSFDKGCFIGQEPVTRLHRRGHANRAPRRVGLSAVVAPGTELVLDGKEAGVVTSVADVPWLDEPRAIAILRVEVPAGAVLDAAGVAATVLP